MDRDQIINALECCSERFGMCDECPYEDEEYCEAEMRSDALALIRELMAENESVRDDTVREMAERIKDAMNNVSRWSFHNDPNEYFIIGKPLIDQIAKEMLEEDQ